MLTWSVASGAGAYSNTRPGTSRPSCRLATAMRPGLLILGEVVFRLVGAGPLLGDLHQHVVEQARRAQSEPLRGHPVGAQRLPEQHQVGDRLFRGADAARRLEADHAAG